MISNNIVEALVEGSKSHIIFCELEPYIELDNLSKRI